MRITNSMMMNNTMLGLTRNMQKLDKLYTQMTTMKRIQRPSDDPIIAGRALKFRTRISETQQFQSNIEQAQSWMSATEETINNIEAIIGKMRDSCVQGASDPLGIEQQKTITDQLDELKKHFINEGNVTYEGSRYLFSGFRTDTKLLYDEQDDNEKFRITESFTKDDVEEITMPGENMYLDTSATPPAADTPPVTVRRIRLAYDDVTNLTGLPVTRTISSTDANAYNPASGEVNFLSDTGELIFNGNDDINTIITGDLEITYDKEGFAEGDINPRNYFKCKDLNTNEEYTPPDEKIQYEVGIKNKIEVNILGKDILTTDLIRDIEGIVNIVNKVSEAQAKVDELTKDGATDEQKELAQSIKNSMPNVSEEFTKLIGKLDGHLAQISTEKAGLGSRMKRLELVNSRLEADELNFTDLNNDNEGVDLEEVYTEFSMQQVVYNSALNAASKIIQPTLLDFIR